MRTPSYLMSSNALKMIVKFALYPVPAEDSFYAIVRTSLVALTGGEAPPPLRLSRGRPPANGQHSDGPPHRPERFPFELTFGLPIR